MDSPIAFHQGFGGTQSDWPAQETEFGSRQPDFPAPGGRLGKTTYVVYVFGLRIKVDTKGYSAVKKAPGKR